MQTAINRVKMQTQTFTQVPLGVHTLPGEVCERSTLLLETQHRRKMGEREVTGRIQCITSNDAEKAKLLARES